MPQLNLLSARRDLAARLAAAGIADAAREASYLLAAALGVDRATLLVVDDLGVTDAQADRLADFTRRRTSREPLARLLGWQEFWGLRFGLNEQTLIPRPETETLVAALLPLLPDRAAPLRLLDLGTGSGCILLALLSELPQATGLGIDAAAGAVAQAKVNAVDLHLADRATFQPGDWTSGLTAAFDIIVANPPYVETGADLQAEVRDFDPAAALFAGPDGLDAYRAMIPPALAHLQPGGLLALEVGAGQAAAVSAILHRADPALTISAHNDLAGIPRVLIALVAGAAPLVG